MRQCARGLRGAGGRGRHRLANEPARSRSARHERRALRVPLSARQAAAEPRRRQRAVHGRFVDLQRRRACRRDPREGRRRRHGRDPPGASSSYAGSEHNYIRSAALRPRMERQLRRARRRARRPHRESRRHAMRQIISSRLLASLLFAAPAPPRKASTRTHPMPNAFVRLRSAIASRRQDRHRRQFQSASAPTTMNGVARIEYRRLGRYDVRRSGSERRGQDGRRAARRQASDRRRFHRSRRTGAPFARAARMRDGSLDATFADPAFQRSDLRARAAAGRQASSPAAASR